MPHPRSGYALPIKVRFYECDPIGHVNNSVYLNYLETVAIEHAADVGWDSAHLLEATGAVFIARRHEIEFFQPAREGDWLLLRTWPADMSGARASRVYDIARLPGAPEDLHGRVLPPGDCELLPKAQCIVRARTDWAFVNPATGRPVRIPTEIINDFLTLDEHRPSAPTRNQ